MRKHRLALIGCGRLSTVVGNALKDGLLPEYELVGVLGKNQERAISFAEQFNCKACTDIDELLDLKPDFTAEAASVQAVREYSEAILKAGSDFIVLSIGAFADEAFYEKTKKLAFENERKVYLANGAIGGFDIIRTAALMNDITSSIVVKKEPHSFAHTAIYKEGLESITEKELLFSGNTKEAIALLPNHVNISVALALASTGPENTKIDIEAVPGIAREKFIIDVKGEKIDVALSVAAKSSHIAGWSVVAVLQNIVSPIVF